MWYIIGISILSLMLLLGVKLNSKSNIDNKINSLEQTNTLIHPMDTIQPIFSLKDIETKLKVLSNTPPPDDLAYGAKCYSVKRPPETCTYICPKCGKKTLYKMKDNINLNLVQWGISACRNEIKNIEGIHIALDESQFCKSCSPNIESPQLCLLVNIDNVEDTTKVCGVDYLDIRLLEEFLDDKLKHKGSHDEESPLVNHIARIQELLGVTSND